MTEGRSLRQAPALFFKPAQRRLLYRHRKRRTARRKLTTIHAIMIPIYGARSSNPAPRRMFARSASTTAVRGRAWIKGWSVSGKRDAEKKTPDKIHIGSITRFISPEAPSMVWAREDTSSPTDVNAREERT